MQLAVRLAAILLAVTLITPVAQAATGAGATVVESVEQQLCIYAAYDVTDPANVIACLKQQTGQ